MEATWVELAAIFIGLPLLFDQAAKRPAVRRMLFPVLWLFAGACLGWMSARGQPALERLWAFPVDHPHLRVVVLRFALLLAVMVVAARRLAGEWFLYLPRKNPALWLLVATFYPLLSVMPQGIIWRVFFATRYAPLMSDVALLLTGAAAFAFGHIIFRNAIAIAITAVGGLMFLHTYLATGSMLMASMEHALYGVAAFSVGLGRFLYLGAARDPDARPPMSAGSEATS